MKCGEKWSKQHKCPEKVSMHVLEEVLAALQFEEGVKTVTTDSSDDEDEDEQQIFQLSHSAAEGIQGRKTIQLCGLVNNQEILILIDSGSSCTVISESAVGTLQCSVSRVPSVTVTVANGQKVSSDKQVSNFTWWTQGHTFSHSARVLSISCYDLCWEWIGLSLIVQCGFTGSANCFDLLMMVSVLLSKELKTLCLSAPKSNSGR